MMIMKSISRKKVTRRRNQSKNRMKYDNGIYPDKHSLFDIILYYVSIVNVYF